MKDENGLYDVGDPLGAAAELSQEAPAFEGRHDLFADASDLGVAAVAEAYWPTAALAPAPAPARRRGDRSR